jgi:hypothetical protein
MIHNNNNNNNNNINKNNSCNGSKYNTFVSHCIRYYIGKNIGLIGFCQNDSSVLLLSHRQQSCCVAYMTAAELRARASVHGILCGGGQEYKPGFD